MSTFGAGNNNSDQKDYVWEIKNTEDANEWLENIGLGEKFSIKKINNVYHVYRDFSDGGLDALSIDLDLLLKEYSEEAHSHMVQPYVVKMNKPQILKSDRVITDIKSANLWLADIGYDGALRFVSDESLLDVQVFEEDWQTIKKVNNCKEAIEYVLNFILTRPEIPNINITNGSSIVDNQEHYIWEINSVEDVNKWIENVDTDKIFKISQIKNNIGSVYCLETDYGDVSYSRYIDMILNHITELIIDFETDNMNENDYENEEEVEDEIERLRAFYFSWKVNWDKPQTLKSNRVITNVESANQWIADLGYEGAIRFDYDENWIVSMFIDNQWKKYDQGDCKDVIERAVGLVLEGLDFPKIEIEVNKKVKKDTEIDSLEAANKWLQSLEKGKGYKFIHKENPFFLEEYFLVKDKAKIKCAITLGDCIDNSCEYFKIEFPNVSDKLRNITPRQNLKTIRNVKDANEWLGSIGKGEVYKFQYTKEKTGTVIQVIKNNNALCSVKEIEKAVDMAVKDMCEVTPFCKNTILDITTLNLWLDTIDFNKYKIRRPFVFRKRTEENDVYSVWDIYRNGDKKETELKFVSTNLYLGLQYIISNNQDLKQSLWEIQLNKAGRPSGEDVILSNFELANKWVASLGYRTTIRFSCKDVEKNNKKYKAYCLQERLSGENWKVVNHTYGTFNNILNLFCKLINITEVPESKIEFTIEESKSNKVDKVESKNTETQKKPEVTQKGFEIPKSSGTQNMNISEIQSVKGANIWLDKVNIRGCKFRMKSREDKKLKRIYTIEFMNSQGQIGTFYECASLKQCIQYFCQYYKIKVPAVANM